MTDAAGHQVLPRRSIYVVPCPVCGSGYGRRCFDVASPGREPRWVAPHVERVRAALELAA